MERLLGGNTDIVVAGDSMMRQFYLRFLQQLRGQRRIFDYRVHTHAKYAFCDEMDVFDNTEYTFSMKQPGTLANFPPDTVMRRNFHMPVEAQVYSSPKMRAESLNSN